MPKLTKHVIEDDCYRPTDSNGNVIEKSANEIRVIINGYNLDWYTAIESRITGSGSSITYKLHVYNWIAALLTSTQSQSNLNRTNIRFVTQISDTSNFSTVAQEIINSPSIGGSGYSTNINIYSRDDNKVAVTHQYHGGYSDGVDWHAYRFDTTSIFTVTFRQKQFWIRSKVQYKNSSGTWNNCARGNGSVWKVFTSYAYFYQTITPPAHVYGNAVNRFTATIPGNYISEIANPSASEYPSDWGSYSYTILEAVVRNPDPPYITSGTGTSYLYVYPGYSVDGYKPEKYLFKINLYVLDPGDTDYMILVASRIVYGNLEYKETDDTDMYTVPTWNVSDPKGAYAEYGVLLRNYIDALNLNATFGTRYGARMCLSCYFVNSAEIDLPTDSFSVSHQFAITPTSPPASQTSARLRFCATIANGSYSGYLSQNQRLILDESIDIPIVNYFLPSLPVAAIHRCDQDGSANDLGAYCRIDWAINVCPINNQNHKTLVIDHPQGSTTYSNNDLTSYTQGGSLIVAANTENSYTITFKISDDLHTITKTMRLSTANVTMDWLYNGQGVAFGKVANKENAVEISEEWKLICYNLLFGNTDMSKWLHQAESRVAALEQFIENIGNTIGNVTQYQVSFYNQDGSELYDRQWVRSGNDATDPISAGRISTPTKEPSTDTTYSYVGWSKTKNDTANDSTALTGISANRNIYAAFSTAVRKYSVMWFNDSILLETDSDLNYHSSQASYGGETPVKSGYTFGGWTPSGRYIESNENAMAQFFEDVEIEDSWEQILQAVDTGTAKSKYKPGNWKTLHTEEGDIPMRILYFNKDTLAGSKATAKITWLSKEYLWNHKIMNPTLQAPVTKTETVADWIRTLETGKYIYTSNIKRKRSSVYPGTVTLTLRCNGAGTLKIGYKYLSSYGTLVITVDGEEKYSGTGGSTSMNYIELTCTAGQTFAVELKAYYGNGGSFVAEGACEKVVEISGTGSSNSVTLVQQTISTRIKTTVDHFIEGSGAIGGWRASQLRAWLNDEFLNGIDPVVRNKIKAVNKCSLSYKADNTNDNGFSLVPNEITHDKIWVPSNSEVGGKFENENQGIDFLMSPGLSYGGLGYWRRTAYTYGNYDLTAADETHEYDSVRGVPRRFGSTYHTEDNQNVSLYFGFCT